MGVPRAVSGSGGEPSGREEGGMEDGWTVREEGRPAIEAHLVPVPDDGDSAQAEPAATIESRE
eukprot:655218-Lingulodinium_polyedra.AAC.1